MQLIVYSQNLYRRFSMMYREFKYSPAGFVWADKATIDEILDFINLYCRRRRWCCWLTNRSGNSSCNTIRAFRDVFKKVLYEHTPSAIFDVDVGMEHETKKPIIRHRLPYRVQMV